MEPQENSSQRHFGPLSENSSQWNLSRILKKLFVVMACNQILNRSFVFVIGLGRYQTLYFQMSISDAIHILFPQILPISKRLAIRKIQRKRRNVKRNQKMTKKEISKNRPISLTIPMHVHAQSFLPGEYGHHQKVEQIQLYMKLMRKSLKVKRLKML